ncbi:hypothetical protein [Halonotius pteroides]|nr:hypothetical protein [Halonotius pteroides]
MDRVAIIDSDDGFMSVGIADSQECTPGVVEIAVDIADLDDWGTAVELGD